MVTAMDKDSKHRNIIEAYIHSYNTCDIEGMLEHMHQNVRFANISDNEISLSTLGLNELRNQAEKALHVFKQREQVITRMDFKGEEVEVNISFRGVLAVDLPNGQHAGDKVELNGRSVFRFAGEKIIDLKDYTL
jgi:ketosteroid isomerase-like protein